MCVGRLLVLVALLSSCSQLTTEAPADGEVFDAPVDGLSPEELAAFTRGDGEFGRRFSPSSGLGPVFNNVSCLSCHSGDGRGELRNALQRIGSPGDDFLRSLGGPQIQDKAIPGAVAERLPTGVHVSLRLPPPVFGVGLIEAIPQATILALADPDDQNGDGISGRANLVTPADYTSAGEPGGGTGTARLGRFGRKAQVSNLLEQVTEAYHQDMGITSDFRPNENGNPLSGLPSTGGDLVPDPEVSAATVRSVVQYIRSLAPPGPGTDTPARVEGRRLFTSIGCEACHVTALQSGTSVVAALSNRRVELYSDLLLHDMGEALADHRPDGMADGREWRTTPLWGLRLMRQFLNGQVLLLHDGRARSVEEAILLHGGEAQGARDRFAGLPASSKSAVVSFVESR